jgi:hypothetical protein
MSKRTTAAHDIKAETERAANSAGHGRQLSPQTARIVGVIEANGLAPSEQSRR